MPDPNVSLAAAGGWCWTSLRRPAKSPAWSTKPATYTCPSSPASATAATRSCAGRSYSKKSFRKQVTTSGPVLRRGRLAYLGFVAHRPG
jgi:hypothetical protein